MTVPPDASPKPFLAPAPAPLDGFSAAEFKARRDALRAACSDSIVLLRGATEDEVSKPGIFHQNSSFFYLTGIETPGAFLVLLPNNVTATSGLRRAGLMSIKPDVREILFLPGRNATAETWSGPQLGHGEEAEAATGIERVVDAALLWKALMQWLTFHPIAALQAPYGENATLTREYALMERLRQIAPIVSLRDCSRQIARQRMIKSPAELERLQEAVRITQAGQRAARRIIAGGAGRYEYEVEAKVLEKFRSMGARTGFASIVGAGFNGTVLHYEDNRHAMKQGDMVVVDIGARLGAYTSDLTRSYPVGGLFSPRQKEIYELVSAAMRRTVADFRLGEDSLLEISDRCKEFLKQAPLKALDADHKEQTMNEFMPHGLSHHLGLDVHDVGETETALPVGSVITIEPGVYIPTEGIGVRLEDDFVVTERGLEPLVTGLEVERSDVERAMAKERD